MTEKRQEFSFFLDDSEALALAQFVKRVGWSEIRQNAVDDAEAYEIRDALGRIALTLAEGGYEPR
jgi:hypothetical protein